MKESFIQALNKVELIRDKKGNTSLHKAVLANNPPMVSDLACLKEMVNVKNDQGLTALHLAADKDPILTSFLIINDANPNLQNPQGETALHLAVAARKVENVRHLVRSNVEGVKIQTNPNVNKRTKGVRPGQNTALHYAFYDLECSNEMVAALLMDNSIKALLASSTSTNTAELINRTRMNISNQDGKTPAYLAFRYQRIQDFEPAIIATIFASTTFGQETTKRKTLLHASAQNLGLAVDVFDKLIAAYKAAGLGLDKTNLKGNTALYYAVKHNDEHKVLALLAQKADPNVYTGSSPLHLACQLEKPVIAVSLIDHGADVNATDANGFHPFFYAVKNNHIDILDALEQKKAKISNDMLQWAVRHAMCNNKIGMLHILITRFKADPCSKADSSPIPTTSLSSTVTALEVKPSKSVQPGDTVLHYAVKHNDLKLVKACLENNKDVVHVLNAKGKSAAYFAIKVLNPEIANELYKNGAKETVQTSLFSETRTKTLLHAGASRHFFNRTELTDFFSKPDYKLNNEQVKIRDEVRAKYVK